MDFESIIQDCGRRRALSDGRRVHHLIRECGLEGDRLLGNLLIQMYGKCGDVNTSLSVFNTLQSPNIFSWTILLEAFAENGHLEDAANIFERMPQRNVASWTTMIKSYGNHCYVDQARNIFEIMPGRNVFSWNAMLSAYAANGDGAEAVGVFEVMSLEGVKANSVTFIIVLTAAARTVSLPTAKLLHNVVLSSSMDRDVKVCNGLINMYGLCSGSQVTRKIFDEMTPALCPMESVSTRV